MLQSRALSFSYAPNSAQLISFPDVELARGDNMVVLGSSGCGKSTLLGLWAGLLSPKQGTITVGTTEVSKLRGSARDAWRSQHVGLVFQSPRLISSQTVAANIELQQLLAGHAVDRSHTQLSLKRLGIAHLTNRLPAQCSVGERQRVGILRALAHKPSLILADEPTSALDRRNAIAVTELLLQEAEAQEATLIVVTHDDRIAGLFSRKLELSPLSHPVA